MTFLNSALPSSVFRFSVRLRLLALSDRKNSCRCRCVAHVRARDVAAFRLLELDHVGTEKAEHLRAGGPRLVVRHVDDADPARALSMVALRMGGMG